MKGKIEAHKGRYVVVVGNIKIDIDEDLSDIMDYHVSVAVSRAHREHESHAELVRKYRQIESIVQRGPTG